jgi:hypothetical protein
MLENTQYTLSSYFNNYKDLTPVDYKKCTKLCTEETEREFVSLPEGTTVVALSEGDEYWLLVKTPDSVYHLVSDHQGLQEFSEFPEELDPTTPLNEMYEIVHHIGNEGAGSYKTYTSKTGVFLHSIISGENTDCGFTIMNKKYTDKESEWYQNVKV